MFEIFSYQADFEKYDIIFASIRNQKFRVIKREITKNFVDMAILINSLRLMKSQSYKSQEIDSFFENLVQLFDLENKYFPLKVESIKKLIVSNLDCFSTIL